MASDPPRDPVVTVSATYGAGGSIVGPAIAARFDVDFLDRAVPSTVADSIGCSLEEAREHDDRVPSGFQRLLASAARLPTVTLGSVDSAFLGATNDEGRLLYDHEFVERTEQVIHEVGREGGVILGRAGAAVLADHPAALHVRLDGDPGARLDRVRRLWEYGDREEARAHDRDGEGPTQRLLEDNDRARAAYVRRFYRVDPDDPGLYHMVLDTTVLSLETCVDLIVRSALDRSGVGTGSP